MSKATDLLKSKMADSLDERSKKRFKKEEKKRTEQMTKQWQLMIDNITNCAENIDINTNLIDELNVTLEKISEKIEGIDAKLEAVSEKVKQLEQ